MLRTLKSESVQCCVTSPPYWGLRDYNVEGQIGLENTPLKWLDKMVEVFSEVKRVLRDDGTLWINIGDSYTNSGRGGQGKHGEFSKRAIQKSRKENSTSRRNILGLKPKNLMMMPARMALALQEDGWYLRSDIIWVKPNAMPESCKDRPTKSHEHIFLFSKSEHYYYDYKSILQPVAESTLSDKRLADESYKTTRPERGFPGNPSQGSGLLVRKSKGNSKTFRGGSYTNDKSFNNGENVERESYGNSLNESMLRNKRDVWNVATHPFAGAHFATFPPKLIEPCILAGASIGAMVLDPFFGAGTTGLVCNRLQRNCIGIDINAEYIKMAESRIRSDSSLFHNVTIGGVA